MKLVFFVLFVYLALVAVSSGAKDDATKRFHAWLVEEGVEMPPVKFVDFMDTGLGAMASEDIESGSKLVDMPKKLFLSSARLAETDLNVVLEQVNGLNTQYQLALVLLNELKDPKSFWKPYLDTLPRTLHTSLFFEDEELEELQGSNIVALTRARKAQLRQNYDDVFPYLFETFPEVFDEETFSYESFVWAIATVWKRSFYLKDGEDTVSVLIPLLDSFNHGPVETNFRLDDEEGKIEVTTNTAMKKGSQVHVSRGPKSNLELLLDFGYTIDENVNDNVALNVRMTGDDELARLKASMLDISGLVANGTYLLFENLIPESLMKALRIQLMREADLNRFSAVVKGRPVSLENELRLLRSVLAACNNMLEGYATVTIEEDESLLKTNLPQRMRSAVMLRMREKQVIQSVMVAVSQKWRDILLDGFPTDAEIDALEEAEAAKAEAAKAEAAKAEAAQADQDELIEE